MIKFNRRMLVEDHNYFRVMFRLISIIISSVQKICQMVKKQITYKII